MKIDYLTTRKKSILCFKKKKKKKKKTFKKIRKKDRKMQYNGLISNQIAFVLNISLFSICFNFVILTTFIVVQINNVNDYYK